MWTMTYGRPKGPSPGWVGEGMACCSITHCQSPSTQYRSPMMEQLQPPPLPLYSLCPLLKHVLNSGLVILKQNSCICGKLCTVQESHMQGAPFPMQTLQIYIPLPHTLPGTGKQKLLRKRYFEISHKGAMWASVGMFIKRYFKLFPRVLEKSFISRFFFKLFTYGKF